jgi:hypothetical protein
MNMHRRMREGRVTHKGRRRKQQDFGGESQMKRTARKIQT